MESVIHNNTHLDKLLKNNKISQQTYDKVIIAKKYIERKYLSRTKQLEEFNIFINKINTSNHTEDEKKTLISEYINKKKIEIRKKREKLTIKNFESLKIIGRGAFGEVHICREKKTGKIYAVKKIKKETINIKNQILHTRNEQQFLSNIKSKWIVNLKYSFQEGGYLFLIMEFCPGGDLMSLLIKREKLNEKEAKFYIAELILSVEEVHNLDCIHRDIKPDNILIDSKGHIKLSDFGLSKISDKIYDSNNNESINNNNDNNYNNKHMPNTYSCVGTAYYVAPEILNKKGYGREVDWWSVGIILFEMLFGYSPFCSKKPEDVCKKLSNWKKHFKIPENTVSKEAEDLIYQLINDNNVRLGKNGAEEIKRHPFFNGIDWENIRKCKPPFIPYLKNDYDWRYFDTYKQIEPFYPKINKFSLNKKINTRKNPEYIGYTFQQSSSSDDDEYGDDDDDGDNNETIYENNIKNIYKNFNAYNKNKMINIKNNLSDKKEGMSNYKTNDETKTINISSDKGNCNINSQDSDLKNQSDINDLNEIYTINNSINNTNNTDNNNINNTDNNNTANSNVNNKKYNIQIIQKQKKNNIIKINNIPPNKRYNKNMIDLLINRTISNNNELKQIQFSSSSKLLKENYQGLINKQLENILKNQIKRNISSRNKHNMIDDNSNNSSNTSYYTSTINKTSNKISSNSQQRKISLRKNIILNMNNNNIVLRNSNYNKTSISPIKKNTLLNSYKLNSPYELYNKHQIIQSNNQDNNYFNVSNNNSNINNNNNNNISSSNNSICVCKYNITNSFHFINNNKSNNTFNNRSINEHKNY